MIAYIIGYNGKENFGDDLMLYSNLVFLGRLGFSNIYVVNWAKSIPTSESKVVRDVSYTEVSGRFFLVVLQILFNCVVRRSFVLFGGGNIFDSKVMGRRLFLLAVLLHVFGVSVYLRGVGFSKRRWYMSYLSQLRVRARDTFFDQTGVAFKDTAYWALKRLRRTSAVRHVVKKRYDAIVFPRFVSQEDIQSQTGYIFRAVKDARSVCIYSMDSSIRKQELLLATAVREGLEGLGIEVQMRVYENFDQIYFDMLESAICIASRLHAGIAWRTWREDESLRILPYSIKHRFEFEHSRVVFIGEQEGVGL